MPADARPRDRGQAREHGDLLRADGRPARRAPVAGRLAARSRARRSTPRTAGGGHAGGAAGFTVGQRRGLGVALGEPRYVSRVDPPANTIVLARRADLETRRFAIADVTFVAGAAAGAAAGRSAARVQVRHRAEAVRQWSARPTRRDRGRRPHRRGARWVVETEVPVWAAAPGQACVLFDADDPDVVVGGGRIVRDDG